MVRFISKHGHDSSKDDAPPAPAGAVFAPSQPPPEERPHHHRRDHAPTPPRKAAETVHAPRHTHPQPPPPEPKKPPPPPTPWDVSQFHVPPVEGKTRFHDLNLPPEVMRAIAELKFEYCTPIQSAIMPKTLSGLDAAGRAQTGTGKTAAFLITIFTHLLRKPDAVKRRPGTPRALILAPTRELVMQIEKDARVLDQHTGCRTFAIFGGMDYDKQRRQLHEGVVDIIAATPGRLLDFKRHGELHLSHVEILVIDEADRMLDMGFIPDVRTIVHSTPPKDRRQTLFFSATLTPEVTRLAAQWTRDPVMVEIAPENVAVDTVNQMVYIVTSDQKFPLLYNLITHQKLERVIVFGNRRDATRRLSDRLHALGISCALLSGDVEQKKRVRTLEDFREGRIRVLVATDVAARGLHVEGISHVVNFNLPMDPEDYVHRIGRTGRAGASGISVGFACEDDSFHIPDIEKYMGRSLPCVYPEESLLAPPHETYVPPPETRRVNRGPPRGGRRPPRRSR